MPRKQNKKTIVGNQIGGDAYEKKPDYMAKALQRKLSKYFTMIPNSKIRASFITITNLIIRILNFNWCSPV